MTNRGVWANLPDTVSRAGEETRTPGLLITSELLYRLSYSGDGGDSITAGSDRLGERGGTRLRRSGRGQREQEVREAHEPFLVDQERLARFSTCIERGCRRARCEHD